MIKANTTRIKSVFFSNDLNLITVIFIDEKLEMCLFKIVISVILQHASVICIVDVLPSKINKDLGSILVS